MTQSALLKAAQHIEGFGWEASMRTWLHRIVTNERRMLRRRKVPASVDELLEEAATAAGKPFGVPAAGPGPEDTGVEAETRRRVVTALAALPDRYRTAVLLKDGLGLPAEEAAAATDISVPAVRPMLHRARLTRAVIGAGIWAHPVPPLLALALRAAPAADGSLDDLAGALLTPVRSGIILTRRRLADAAGETGTGHRIGERRFTLRAMLEQDPAAILSWLAVESGGWTRRHASRPAGDAVSQWWAVRAAGTTRVLRERTVRTSMFGRPAGVSVP